MAFRKFANALVLQNITDSGSWTQIRGSAQRLGTTFGERKAKTIFSEFDPKRYLLSHCSIMASVDVQRASVKTGRQMVDGYEINRLYDDFLITPDTQKYANNNHDAWERNLLLSSFPTFVGGENYVEHLQIPEMSKGKIVDAVARDIGEAIYIDLLIATDRKHQALVAAVQKKELNTLSMGCTVEFTICSKCGNVAYDETQLCPHIRFAKGKTFTDNAGVVRRIVELCGHIRNEPGSVKFIEASWVGSPAFTGAVLRNILSEDEAILLSDRIQVAFSTPTRQTDAGSMQRAARLVKSFTFGEDDEDPEGAPDTGTDTKEEDPLTDAVRDLKKNLIDRLKRDIEKDLSGKDDQTLLTLDPAHSEQTLVKEAAKEPYWRRVAQTILKSTKDPVWARKVLIGLLLHHQNGWNALKSHGFTGREILAVSRFVDRLAGHPDRASDTRVYRTILAVGGIRPYGDTDGYLAACRRVMGRDLSSGEIDTLVSKGKLFDLAG